MHGAVRDGDIEAVLRLWSAGGAQSRAAVKAMAQDGALRWADSLLAHSSHGARAAAAVLARTSEEAETIGARLHTLATHEESRVRAAAAQALGLQLTERFAELLPVVQSWATDPSPSVRRAAVEATAQPASTGNFSWAEPLLRTLGPLLSDRCPQVRRSLGPGVLARVYLDSLPDDTVEHLAQWSTSHNEQVLWNVAMTLSGPAVGRVAGKALIVLRKLALDDRPYVRAAVTAALTSLTTHAPRIAVARLERWLADDERAPVARAALRHST